MLLAERTAQWRFGFAVPVMNLVFAHLHIATSASLPEREMPKDVRFVESICFAAKLVESLCRIDSRAWNSVQASDMAMVAVDVDQPVKGRRHRHGQRLVSHVGCTVRTGRAMLFEKLVAAFAVLDTIGRAH